MKDVSA